MKFINDTELLSSLIIVNMNLPANSSLDQQPQGDDRIHFHQVCRGQ